MLSHRYTIILFLVALFAVTSTTVLYAQDPNDCEGAIVICDDGPVSYDPIGPGNFDFANTLCGTTEHQSAWYYIEFSDTMPINQILEFTITPTPSGDYDFAMWGPNVDCDELDMAGMVRCNFHPAGVTGLMVGGTGPFEEALTVNPGEGYYLMVDNFSISNTGFSITWGGSAAGSLDCNANPSCDLEADAGDPITFCAGEEFTLSGIALGGNGNETYNWRANPPSVTQYITDTSAAITTVILPPGAPGEMEFLLTIKEDSCEALGLVSAVISAPVEPQFSFDPLLCDDDGVFTLPTTSDDGVIGTWTPTSIDPSTATGSINAIFMPTPNQGACADSASLWITIETSILPEFSIPTPLCESDEVYVFPVLSDNGITGTWTPASFDPADFPGSDVMSTFTASDAGCFSEVTVTVDVDLGIEPEFLLDITICESADPITLNTISDDGFPGVWDVPIIDPSGLAGASITSTFTPDANASFCLIPYTHTWDVTPLLIPEFDPIPELCALDDVLVLPIESNNSLFTGTWTPSSIDPSLGAGDYNAVFTAAPSFGDCIADVSITVTVTDEITPNFDSISICDSEGVLILPTSSLNGISGTWAPTLIDPSGQGGTIVLAEFTPAQIHCSPIISMPIEINETVDAEFDLPTAMCEGDDIIPLLNISMNGIVGTWSIPELNPEGNGGGFIVAEFTPDENSYACSESQEYIITVDEPIVPEFIIDNERCETDAPIFLETTSLNGVVGTWSIPTINPAGAAGTSIQSVFTPNEPSCISTYVLDVDIVGIPEVSSLSVSDPSDCGIEDGQIFVTALSSDVVFSIDGGGTWTDDGNFDNLAGGNYTILMRSGSLFNCISVIDTVLVSPGAPMINETSVQPISDCGLEDGSISIDATGTNLEYSIDGGMTWSSNSEFNDLPPGSYDIVTREASSPTCQTTALEVIALPEEVNIDTIILSNISDCAGDDGRISIVAQGGDLEYSIDGGATYFTSGVFIDLQAGLYEIMVRHRVRINCLDMEMATLIEPSAVSILSLTPENLTDCQSADGRITVNGNSANLEYSIDNGVSWQVDNIFENLDAGNYSVIARLIGTVDCNDEMSVSITAPNAPQLDSVVVSGISDCLEEDGMAAVYAAGVDLQYSINAGVDWQTSPVFEDLPPGNYTVFVRPSLLTNCSIQQSFEIENLESPSIQMIDSEGDRDCQNDNGFISISASGSNIEFSLDGINWQEEELFDELIGGQYDIFVREIGYPNCVDSTTAFLSTIEPPEIIEVSVIPLSDCNLSDGRIEILAGSSNLLEYSIDDGLTWSDDPLFEDLSDGEYIIIVRDQLNPTCMDMSQVTLLNPPCACNFQFDAFVTQPLCFGELGAIEVSSQQSDLEFDIAWEHGPESTLVEELGEGSYSYELTFLGNCVVRDSFTIQSPSEIQAEFVSFDASCRNSADGSIEILQATGGSGALSFSLDGEVPQSALVFENLESGAYAIEIIDENNCSVFYEADVLSSEDISVAINGQINYLEGSLVLLEGIFNEEEVDRYYWLDADGEQVGDERMLEVVATENTTYTLVIVYGDCENSASFNIQVRPSQYYFPNAFSPNNDGINDFFFPFSSSSSTDARYDIQIFNRWGGLVFERANAELNQEQTGWSGRQRGKLSPEGVYMYHATIYPVAGEKQILTGEVVIIR